MSTGLEFPSPIWGILTVMAESNSPRGPARRYGRRGPGSGVHPAIAVQWHRRVEQKTRGGTSGVPALVNGAAWGTSLANLGDLDGDGFADLAVGALRDGSGAQGSVTILRLNGDGAIKANTSLQSGLKRRTGAWRCGLLRQRGGERGGPRRGWRDGPVGRRAWRQHRGTNRGAVHVLRLRSDGTVKAASVLTSGGTNMRP